MNLIDAIVSIDESRVAHLLAGGADVFACEDNDNITPLHHAVSASSITIIFLLLEYGANPNKRYSKTGKTAFELACSLNRYDAISLFSHIDRSCIRH
jgi:ankyrin repeat protein